MGKILRQSIKGTVYSYIGVGLGFITSALVMPHVLTPAQIGVLSLLLSYSVIFMQFSTLGFNSVTSRFFTYFRSKENNHHGYLFLVVAVGLIGFIVFSLVFFIGKPWLISISRDKSALFIEYINLLLPLTFFTVFFFLFDAFYTVLYNSTFGTFLRELVMRILILCAIAFYALHYLAFTHFVWLYSVALCLPTVFIVALLIKQGYFNLKPQFGFISKDLRKSMISMAAFGFLFGMGGILIQNINTIMINSLLGLAATGIFTITFYFGNIIIVPSRPLSKISSAIIADAWKNNDMNTIKDVYYKSCLTQFIIGLCLFLLVYINLDHVFSILPKTYISGRNVIVFIGLANVFNMLTGVNIYIIYTSKHYKVLAYYMVVQIVLAIVLNYVFIKLWGISGAALAYFVNYALINILYYFHLLVKYNLQPFNRLYLASYAKLLALTLVVYVVAVLIPNSSNWIVDASIRSFVFLSIFLIGIYKLNVSKDINELMEKIILFVKGRS